MAADRGRQATAGAGVHPTPAGTALLPHARALLRGREKAVHAVHEHLGRVAGRLDIAASSVPGTYLLPRVLATLRGAHPDLRISLRVSDSGDAIEILKRGDVDLAVVGRSIREKGLVTTKVAEDEVVLVGRPELFQRVLEKPTGGGTPRRAGLPKSIAITEIVRLPMVLRETGSATRGVAMEMLGAGSHS